MYTYTARTALTSINKHDTHGGATGYDYKSLMCLFNQMRDSESTRLSNKHIGRYMEKDSLCLSSTEHQMNELYMCRTRAIYECN